MLAYALSLILALNAEENGRAALGATALVGAVAFSLALRPVNALVSGVVAAGALVGSATIASDARCARVLASDSSWRAAFEGDAAPGGVVHASVSGRGCTARATILVGRGTAREGEVATVSGEGSSGARGLFIRDGIVGPSSRGPLARTLRASTSRRIDRIFGSDSAMARALVMGDMTAIPPEVRERYARAGLVHMLSVSGLHVGIIALALELLASVLRLPPRPARIATLILVGTYVAGIGAPSPAVRAAVMLGALLLTRLLQRPTSPWAILALGAGAPLLDPHVAIDLGWQLSVVGTAALISGAALARRAVPRTWSGLRRSLATATIISVVATIATTPLVAWTFGRVAVLGPLTNLVADPIMGILQPVLFVGVAIPVHAVEHAAADAAHALLFLFDAVAVAADHVPFAAPAVMTTVPAAIAAGIGCAAVLVACVARHPARPALTALCALAFLTLEPFRPMRRGAPELHMLDVGQGDALAVRTSRGRWIVIDAGREWTGGDAGRSVVAPYVSHRGGDVALFILSHPHADHVGGAASLLSLVHPAGFIDPGYVGTAESYAATLREAMRDGIPWRRVRPGDSLSVDDVSFTLLAPDSAWASSLADANLASTVLIMRAGGARILFMGDAEAPEEQWLLRHARDSLRADVLKVGHHGSSTSTTADFLDAVHPRVALVSVGAHNMYGHPNLEVLDALHDAGALTLRTDRVGTVVLRFLGDGIDVSARDVHWSIPRQVTR